MDKSSMELTAGYPFWLIKNGLPFQYNKLLQDISTEVIIIGGGISGALAAHHLIESGISCVVVDARSIGLGSTCASTALLQYELDIPLHQLKKKIGNEKAIRTYRVSGESIDKLIALMHRIGFSECEERGSLFFSLRNSQKQFMREEFESRKEAGFEVELLSAETMRSSYGLSARHGILSAKGACIDAYALTHALLQCGIQKGLQVFDRTRITEIHDNEQGIKVTTQSGYHVNAKKLVNATGYEVKQFIKKNIVDFYCTYAMISENQEERKELWQDRIMLWNTEDPYLYIRLTRDNRIIVGGRDEPFNNSITREVYLNKKALALEKDFKKLFPELSFNREFVWSGTFGKTKDSLPYIGALSDSPNIYYALGFGGNGICFSLIAAEILRDHILGKPNRDADLFGFERA
jgi:glycine/D-amino acid oxidase-like deaminating enzyme